MKAIIVILFCFLFHCISFAQPVIEVKYEIDSKGNYQFSCNNSGYCNYIVQVSFTDLQNLRADFRLPYSGVVRPGSNALFKLSKEIQSSPTNFRYAYKYIKGCLKPNINGDYAYLLPVAPGKETRISELYYFLKRHFDEPEPKDWYAISIKMNVGDTVYASRRGRVNEVKDNANLRDSGYTMASTDNYVEIFHADCSFARYQVFRDKSIFVKPGEYVEAGDPLGIVGGEKYASGPHVRFCVYYTLGKNPFPEGEKTSPGMDLGYVPVQFWTKDIGKLKLANNSRYTSEHPVALITGEMNNREVKRWTEKHTH